MWIYMELQWPLVAENKTTFKIDGGEFLSCHQPFSVLKRGQKGIVCWNSLQICGRVTLALVNYFLY